MFIDSINQVIQDLIYQLDDEYIDKIFVIKAVIKLQASLTGYQSDLLTALSGSDYTPTNPYYDPDTLENKKVAEADTTPLSE